LLVAIEQRIANGGELSWLIAAVQAEIAVAAAERDADATSPHEHADPLVIDAAAGRILDLSDGTRSAAQINAELNQEGSLSDDGAGLDRIEKLFSHGLILLVEEERRNAVHDEDCPPFVEAGVAEQ
jgi:hypothetical protein